MAGTAKLFSRILHDGIDLHAAWLPIANSFQPGDYGLVSDGVLVKMGNVAEFGVDVVTRQTEQVSLDFSSQGTRRSSASARRRWTRARLRARIWRTTSERCRVRARVTSHRRDGRMSRWQT